jgi:hypothetical protein
MLSLLSGATFINAQETKCALKINQAPELRGFRLGMTTEQVKSRFPFVRVRESGEFDFYRTANVPGEYLKTIDSFRGVEGLGLTFLDDKIISISVSYDPIEWKSEEHFSTRVGEMLKLPNAWQRSNINTGYNRQLECDGFQVRTRVNHINLINPVEYQNLERRQQEQVERKKE